MKYSVVWHDCEDDRTGQEFTVEAEAPCTAYYMAVDHIRGLSDYLRDNFCGVDIECLVDYKGKSHYPDFFLDSILEEQPNEQG